MEWSLQELVIVCPLVFLAGFVDAIAGGGGLISLPAYLLAGFPVHFAIGTNKLSALMGSVLVTTRFTLKGFVPWRIAFYCVVGSLVGSQFGAHIALMLNDHFFKILMLFIIPPTAYYVLRGKALLSESAPFSLWKTTVLSVLIAFACGAYDGFYGPGAGTFMLLLLVAAAHMPLTEANGTAKAMNLASNLAAFVVFLLNGKVLIPLGLLAGVFCIVGSYIGSRFFERGGARVVRPIMLTVLTLFFIRVLTEVLPPLFNN
ncbi:MAG: sulfite exporter TauE/SafE family protein [Synergistaceae bacterium]|nr:sulfite exporter TauE/SafE family protein [Synergistaceae bacterium]